MTLIVTLLTPDAIFQSSDYRLTDPVSKKLITNSSNKVLSLQYTKWNGFVSYTGVGRWRGKYTSSSLVEWIANLREPTFGDLAGIIQEKGTSWLTDIASHAGYQPHTFVLSGFDRGVPRLAVISNFEALRGQSDQTTIPDLKVTQHSCSGVPLLKVSGIVSRLEQGTAENLVGLIRRSGVDPLMVRNELVRINQEVARSSSSEGTVSPQCSVMSLRPDGSGFANHDGSIEVQGIINGAVMPNFLDIARTLGVKNPKIKGSTFGNSAAKKPNQKCIPIFVEPDMKSGYSVEEIKHDQLKSGIALSVNNCGLVVGRGQVGVSGAGERLWHCSLGSAPELLSEIGTPGAVNNAGVIAATITVRVGQQRSWVSDQGYYEYDNEYVGCSTGARGINDWKLVAGWVCIDTVDQGQSNFRPAAWLHEDDYVLEQFSCDWGEGIQVNNSGKVLVVGYKDNEAVPIVWEPISSRHEIVGATKGIFPMSMSNTGVVLGKYNNSDHKPVACVCRVDGNWETLGTEPGYYAVDINDEGFVTGSFETGGVERPWIMDPSGNITWLPFMEGHHCRPTAINENGSVVGYARADHGSHPLVWSR